MPFKAAMAVNATVVKLFKHMVAPWLGKPICHGNGQHTVIGKLAALLEYLNRFESSALEFISGTYHITGNGTVDCIIPFFIFFSAYRYLIHSLLK